jgi:hypothetical protein
MRGVLFSAAIAVGALSAFTVTPAAARDYAYCAQGRGVGIPGDCSYSSYQQCLASASGRNLSCNVNPRVAFARQRSGRGYDDRDYAPRERAYRRGYRNDFDGYDRR